MAIGEVEEVGEVAERLRHLLAAHLDEAVVHPVAGERAAERQRLGPLVLVVGEGEVLAAAVEIEVLAQQVQRHHDALGVPARPPLAPGGRPGGLARLGPFPEHEVGGVALLLDRLDAGAAQQRIERLAGQEAVTGNGGDVEVDAVARLVGLPGLDEVADELDHLTDVGGGVWIVGRALDADAVHGVPPDDLAATGDLGGIPVLRATPLDDLVVDVGDVRDVGDLEAAPLQVATQHVEDEREPSVAQVRRSVDGGPADVHRHLARLTGLQGHDLALRGVEDLQHGVPRYPAGTAPLGVQFAAAERHQSGIVLVGRSSPTSW